MKGFPDLPPIWAIGAAAMAWLLARWLPLAALPAAPAWPLVVVGAGLIAWSAWWFHVKRTPIEPHHLPRALIVEGPYRINRNPIYTGLTLMLVGWAFGLGAVSALLPAAAFPLVITVRFVRDEEAGLRAAFGKGADAYLAATRRW